uniref:Ig-like domain-containing protein n=1 Tax=Anopheles culicifacies TaxID=139723 RepID=A0A182M474_9DIPT
MPRTDLAQVYRTERRAYLFGNHSSKGACNLGKPLYTGRPQPSVKWLINGILVDEQYEHNSGDVIENRLLWPAIQRSDLNSIFTCQATNTLLVEPKESSFVLDLHQKHDLMQQ